MKTIEINTYKFEELPEKTQKELIEKNVYIDVEHCEWYEFVYEDAMRIAEIMGISIKDIFFMLHRQGAGSMFTGYYSYEKNSVKKILEECPMDKELHRIVKSLQILQKKFFYGLSADIEQYGHYHHENSNTITINHPEYYSFQNHVWQNIEDELTQILRDYMVWIFDRLNEEYDYLTSEENIKERLIMQDDDYTINGRIW